MKDEHVIVVWDGTSRTSPYLVAQPEVRQPAPPLITDKRGDYFSHKRPAQLARDAREAS